MDIVLKLVDSRKAGAARRSHIVPDTSVLIRPNLLSPTEEYTLLYLINPRYVKDRTPSKKQMLSQENIWQKRKGPNHS